MPTLFKRKYTGSSLEHRGEQRVFPGDRVYVNGREDLGLLSSIDGPAAMVEFGSGETKELKKVTCELMRAMANREEREPRSATGRSGGGHLQLTNMLGLGEAMPTVNNSHGDRPVKGPGSKPMAAPKKGKWKAIASATPPAEGTTLVPTGEFEIGAQHAPEELVSVFLPIVEFIEETLLAHQ